MYKYKDTEIHLLEGDITKMATDAVVNAANNTLLGGGGVDGAIHRAGGPIILEQCKKIGGCPTGEARITTAGNMPSKYVIHTVGPIYKEASQQEAKFLYRAYYNSLKLAREYRLETIAFPSISTGAYNYPIREACEIALGAVRDFLDEENKIREIHFVLFNDEDYKIYKDYLERNFQ